jgi:DNA (cytosine-5)-methyltransferase 1
MTVASLFAGIGGIELGFAQAGFQILWAIEKDHKCCLTYRHNHKEIPLIEADICNVDPHSLSTVDVIAAGFPCQPFSIAGRQRGFCDNRGNLFYEVIRFVQAIQPRVVFLENVQNLQEHDNGRTFITIHNALVESGYYIRYRVMRASEYGNVPQIRDRIYIVAFKDIADCDVFKFPDTIPLTVSIDNIINRHEEKNRVYYYQKNDLFFAKVREIVTDQSSIYRVYHESIKITQNHMCPTLTASMGMQRDQVPLVIDNYGIRKLTLRECLDFQGFPKDFYFPNTITIEDAYKQCGNTVCVPVVKRVAERIIKIIR